ncbi:MAG: hypothetical protein ACK5V3_12060 [Bdellovibrionales bacterium]
MSISLAHSAEPLTEGFNFAEQIRVEKDLARSSFNMGTDFVNLTGDGGSIMGLGFKAGFEYGFTEKFSLGTHLMFTFQASGKPGAFFYSGVNGILRYTYRGVNFSESTVVKKRDGVILVKTSPEVVSRSTVFGGFEQLFLNGASNVYPAIGLTVGTSRAFMFWERSVELDLRYSMLQANDNPLGLIGLGATFNLDL